MENLKFEFAGGEKPLPAGASYVVVGVVASSNLEVLAERKDLGGKCRFEVATTAANFSETWKAVFVDFMDRSQPRDVLFRSTTSLPFPQLSASVWIKHWNNLLARSAP